MAPSLQILQASLIVVLLALSTVTESRLDISLRSERADVLFDLSKELGTGPIVELFRTYIGRFGKVYRSSTELASRYRAFIESMTLIEEAKSRHSSYELELNEFADWTWEEFKKLKLGSLQNCSATKGNFQLPDAVDIPPKKDWRDTGIVSPVKNQGHCGSCWTFSTTGALEAAFAQATGKSVLLSEQQLVDCAGQFNNKGCGGGLPSQAFEYVKYNGGLDTETSYPYFGVDGLCHFDSSGVGASVAHVVNITEYDEASLHQAVAHVKPVSIAFEVAKDFRLYKSGVYASTECHTGPDTVNHAVLAVGYDTTGESPFWIIKNSWGTAWGEKGYFRMELGKNMCGIATCASYPVV